MPGNADPHLLLPETATPNPRATGPAPLRPRVAVLTFHFHYNYGGVLQAYGLQEALNQLGYEAIFPSSVPKYCRYWINWRGLLGPHQHWGLRTVVHALAELPRRRAFDEFRRRQFPAAVRGPRWNEVVADPRLVAAVVGSDQVWNLKWMRAWDPYYFLGSLPEDTPIRRIGYAACFGTSQQRPDYLQRAIPLLSRFTAIGVRTETTRHLVEEHTSLRTAPVVDPTLLHDFRELRGRRPCESDYIVFYGIRPEALDRGRQLAQALQRRTGLPIVLLVPESFVLEGRPAIDWADRTLWDASPADWVEAIRQCSCLVTDSFHGTLFATRLRRPFLAYPQGVTAERIVDVTKRYGLGSRVVSGAEPESQIDLMFAPIDFEAVHQQLHADREASLEFLRQALAKPAQNRALPPRAE